MTTRDDYDQAKPRCPRCEAVEHMEPLPLGSARRWWCGACNLACDGTGAEHRAASLRRQAQDADEAARQRSRLSTVRGELS